MASGLVFRLNDGGPELLREVLLERGWEEYDDGERDEEDWNLYWRGSTFHSSDYHNLMPWQRLNHHPKTAGITRKDCLARNLRRMRATFGSSFYDFSPTAFILPNDYTRFLSEYNKLHRTRRPSEVYWICKPVDLSRGRGIFIFEDIRDLVYDCPVIVQRYVSRPLLISGYKFDLRIYVCVKSFHPLTIYIHQEGLVRFATEKYDLSSLHNLYAHLTNTSINKLGPFYRADKGGVGPGCKWTMSKFRHFLYSQDIDELLLWQRISSIVTLTLLAIAPSVPSCPNCVELFGFDVLIDARLKPWLLEVNYSPALSLDCPTDIAVKKGLIGDLIDLMNYSSIDSLRDRAYQKRQYKQPCFNATRPSRLSIPLISKKKKSSNKASKSQLPLLKPLRQPERINCRQARPHGVEPDDEPHLPPVSVDPVFAARGRIINTKVTKTQAGPSLNLILGPRTGPARASRDKGSLHKSEVTNHDHAENEAEADISSLIPDTQQRRPGFRRPEGSWRLPDILSGTHRPVGIPVEEPTGLNGPQVPPLRVGDFIRTFPFNAATLKASQHKLDLLTVLRELHRLTAQLASVRSDRMKRRRTEEDEMNAEDDFESLLWGPREPPLISQCLKATSRPRCSENDTR